MSTTPRRRGAARGVGLKWAKKKVGRRYVAPPELKHVLVWYQEIRNQTHHGMGVEPIEFVAIQAYSALYRLSIEPWEVDLLCRLDGVWLKSIPPPEANKGAT